MSKDISFIVCQTFRKDFLNQPTTKKIENKTQCPRADLNKKSLPRPKTTAA